MTKNLQDQNSKIKECEKLSFLRNIYDENERAAYVYNIILKSDRSNIAKLRICAHNLEIEKGHYFQINRVTPRNCGNITFLFSSFMYSHERVYFNHI